jgi:V/A-type H+-transporting ATPase subunit I
MAVARLKKIQILGHDSERDRVLEFLQHQGQVEVVDLKDKSDEYKDFSFERQSVRYEEVKEAVEKLSWLMSFFESLSGKRRSRLAAKPVFRRKDLLEIVSAFDYPTLHSREIESALRDIEKKKLEHEGRRKELLPWIRLDVPLNQLGETRFTNSALASVGEKAFPALKESVASFPEVHMEVVDQDKATVYFAITYLRAFEEQVAELLREHDVSLHHLPRHPARVEEVLNHISADDRKLESERLALLEEARGLLLEETKVVALMDYFSNMERKEGTKERLLYSRESFFLEGWIRQSDAPAAQKRIEKLFDSVEVYVSDPLPDDTVPTVLENKNVVRPFEFLTRVYGYPGYQGVDPTPFLAPFFFVFFGFCLGDAVYGLVLVLVSLFALKKLKMGWQGTRFFRLMLYCGLSTIVVGALTGSWMGNLLGIPAILLDPQKEPTRLLNIALVLGIVQIWTGYAVAAYGSLRLRKYKDALLDQLPIFVLLAGLTVAGLIFLKTLSAKPTNVKLCLTLIGAGALVILAAHGRSQRSLAGKLGFGVLSFYWAASGYLSDILSYSRLWALGLVTGAMASTVNLIASTVRKSVPVVGVVLAVTFLAGGHIFTLLISVLGAFVHSMRLQFVEFFSKFFSTSGRPFRPLSIENKFTVIEE